MYYKTGALQKSIMVTLMHFKTRRVLHVARQDLTYSTGVINMPLSLCVQKKRNLCLVFTNLLQILPEFKLSTLSNDNLIRY